MTISRWGSIHMSSASFAALVLISTLALLLALGNVSFELHFTTKYAQRHLEDLHKALNDRDGEFVKLVGLLQREVDNMGAKQLDASNARQSADAMPALGSGEQDCPPHLGTWIEPPSLAHKYLQDQVRAIKNVGNITDLVWQPLDERCSLEDYWSKLTVERKPTALDGKSILFIGDSLDKYIVRDFCTAWSGRPEPALQMARITPQTPEQDKRCCSYPNDNYLCKTPQLTLGNLWLMGVSLEEPYYTQQNYVESTLPLTPVERIKAAGPMFIREMGGRPPDMVVVRSLFWDLARLSEKEPDEIATLWARKSLEGVMQNWITNATRVLQSVQQTFPNSKIAWITTPCPREGKGYHQRRYVGKLNAAGRFVAKSMGIQVIDLDMMASELTVEERTFDGKHPSPPLNRAIVNICGKMIAK